MWFLGAVLSYEKVEITILLTSLKNIIFTRIGTFTHYLKQGYKALMAMHVLRSHNRNYRALVYFAAKDFVHLTYMQKFQLGYHMGFLDHFDSLLNEDELENKIFFHVLEDRRLDDFMLRIKSVPYE